MKKCSEIIGEMIGKILDGQEVEMIQFKRHSSVGGTEMIQSQMIKEIIMHPIIKRKDYVWRLIEKAKRDLYKIKYKRIE